MLIMLCEVFPQYYRIDQTYSKQIKTISVFSPLTSTVFGGASQATNIKYIVNKPENIRNENEGFGSDITPDQSSVSGSINVRLSNPVGGIFKCGNGQTKYSTDGSTPTKLLEGDCKVTANNRALTIGHVTVPDQQITDISITYEFSGAGSDIKSKKELTLLLKLGTVDDGKSCSEMRSIASSEYTKRFMVNNKETSYEQCKYDVDLTYKCKCGTENCDVNEKCEKKAESVDAYWCMPRPEKVDGNKDIDLESLFNTDLIMYSPDDTLQQTQDRLGEPVYVMEPKKTYKLAIRKPASDVDVEIALIVEPDDKQTSQQISGSNVKSNSKIYYVEISSDKIHAPINDGKTYNAIMVITEKGDEDNVINRKTRLYVNTPPRPCGSGYTCLKSSCNGKVEHPENDVDCSIGFVCCE